jgi:hypothetical protein
MNISTASAAELVAFFNANCERAGMKPVKKFADRKTAERRVDAMIAALPAAKIDKDEKPSGSISEGVKASWSNPEVKAARSERTNIFAGRAGQEMQYFRSVREAFRFFGLPDSKHIKFRMAFKAGTQDAFEGVTFAQAVDAAE